MRTLLSLWSGSRRVLAGIALVTMAFAPAARAAVLTYTATLDGPSESPPNAPCRCT